MTDTNRKQPLRHPESKDAINRDRHDAVLLDLDGVITDTASVHAACWKQMFDEYLQKRATQARRCRGRRGEKHGTTLVASCARSLGLPNRGGAGPGHSIRANLRSGPFAGRQSTAVRQRGAAKCGRACPSRALRYMEQSANKEPRLLHDTQNIPVGRYGVPSGAPSHRRGTAPSS